MGRQLENLIGKKFGNLTIVERNLECKKYTQYKCVCSCGRVIHAQSGMLKSKRITNCGCKIFDKHINIKYGRIRILSWYKEGKKVFYNCECDCGTKFILSSKRFVANKIRTCGCKNKKRFRVLDRVEMPKRLLFSSYKSQAKKRKLKFSLSLNDFLDLTNKNCFYCGEEPKQIIKSCDNYKYIYNGLDRLNNKKGYILNNCVPCCKKCNTGKMDSSYDEFTKWIKLVYNNITKETK